MPTPEIPEPAVTLLRQPRPAVMATVRPDGSPVTVATWYLYTDDGRILLTLDAARKRLDHLRADPRISLTVLAEDWYTQVRLQGRVVEIADDPDLAGADLISTHYTGHAYPNRTRPRVTAIVEIDRFASWNLT